MDEGTYNDTLVDAALESVGTYGTKGCTVGKLWYIAEGTLPFDEFVMLLSKLLCDKLLTMRDGMLLVTDAGQLYRASYAEKYNYIPDQFAKLMAQLNDKAGLA